MFRSKKGLIFYQLCLSLFTTTVVLGVILRPHAGWIKTISALWENRQPASVSTKEITNQSTSQLHQVEYDLNAALDVNKSVVLGTAVISIPSVPDDKLLFYLYPSTYKPIQIEQVIVDGKPTPFSANDEQLTVPNLKQGASAEIKIQFSTPIPETGTRLGEKDGVWSLTYWYPILAVREKGNWIPRPDPHPYGDPFLMDLASYHVKLTYPAAFHWYTSGVSVSSRPDDQSVITEWKADNIRNFALIGGQGWQEIQKKTASGTVVTVAALNADHLKHLQEIVDQSFTAYTHFFGNLAAPSFSVIEMPSETVFAHEYPNMALFSTDIWDWKTGEHWIAHEIAHGWWFSSVGTYKALNPWLDEGLADYSAYLYQESKEGHTSYQQAMQANWDLFRKNLSYDPHEYGTPIDPKNLHTDLPYSSFTNEADYYSMMYLRPVLMYHDLRKAMGDTKFFDFLQQFYLKNLQTTTTRQRLEEALKDVAPDQLPRLKMWLDMPNGQLLETVKNRFE